MKTLTLLALLICNNVMAFDGGLSVIKKEEFTGIAFKAEFFRIEYLVAKSNTVRNDSIMAITDNKKELNLAIEPDFSILKHKNFKIEVSPLIGLSTKLNDALQQSKGSSNCSMVGGALPGSECFSNKKTRDTSLLAGASLKFDIEPSDRLHFYTKVGAYNNDKELDLKPQASVGFTIPW